LPPAIDPRSTGRIVRQILGSRLRGNDDDFFRPRQKFVIPAKAGIQFVHHIH
jgi:hypothetical protein